MYCTKKVCNVERKMGLQDTQGIWVLTRPRSSDGKQCPPYVTVVAYRISYCSSMPHCSSTQHCCRGRGTPHYCSGMAQPIIFSLRGRYFHGKPHCSGIVLLYIGVCDDSAAGTSRRQQIRMLMCGAIIRCHCTVMPREAAVSRRCISRERSIS